MKKCLRTRLFTTFKKIFDVENIDPYEDYINNFSKYSRSKWKKRTRRF